MVDRPARHVQPCNEEEAPWSRNSMTYVASECATSGCRSTGSAIVIIVCIEHIRTTWGIVCGIRRVGHRANRRAGRPSPRHPSCGSMWESTPTTDRPAPPLATRPAGGPDVSGPCIYPWPPSGRCGNRHPTLPRATPLWVDVGNDPYNGPPVGRCGNRPLRRTTRPLTGHPSCGRAGCIRPLRMPPASVGPVWEPAPYISPCHTTLGRCGKRPLQRTTPPLPPPPPGWTGFKAAQREQRERLPIAADAPLRCPCRALVR